MYKVTGHDVSRRKLRFSVVGPINYFNQTYFNYKVGGVLEARRKGKPVQYKACTSAGMIGSLAERLASSSGYRQNLRPTETIRQQIENGSVDVVFILVWAADNITVPPELIEYGKDRNIHIEPIYLYT